MNRGLPRAAQPQPKLLTTDPPTPRLRRDRLDGWHGWFPSRKELNRTDGPRNTRRTRTKQISSPKFSGLFAYLVGKISYSWRAENLRKTRRISPIAVRMGTDKKWCKHEGVFISSAFKSWIGLLPAPNIRDFLVSRC